LDHIVKDFAFEIFWWSYKPYQSIIQNDDVLASYYNYKGKCVLKKHGFHPKNIIETRDLPMENALIPWFSQTSFFASLVNLKQFALQIHYRYSSRLV
jgi:hypothetical protein